MIVGIGEDIVDIRRIEKIYVRHGRRFLDRCFTTCEQAKAESRARGGGKYATLAKRFAAKEALVKALGTGFSTGISFQDIEIDNNPEGRPFFNLKEGVRKKLEDRIPSGCFGKIHLTLSDEPPLAKALVIIEAVDN